MTETAITILTAIAIATMIVMPIGFYIDASGSLIMQYYGGTEGNKLFADKYGYFSRSGVIKDAAIAAGLLTASTIVWLYAPVDFKAVSVILLCGLSSILPWARGLNNIKIRRVSRENQIKSLKELHKIVADGGDTAIFWNTQRINLVWESGRIRYKRFGWIYRDGVSAENKDIALREIEAEIEAISQRPQSEWFPK